MKWRHTDETGGSSRETPGSAGDNLGYAEMQKGLYCVEPDTLVVYYLVRGL
jgi:hypothetical protein